MTCAVNVKQTVAITIPLGRIGDTGRADTIVFSVITHSWQCWHYVLFRSEKKNKFNKNAFQ